jgi:hypothetical protein
MNVNLYLPDELGEKAKAADLPLSRLLQRSVTEELQRREAVTKTMKDAREHLVDLETKEGYAYQGRINGIEVHEDDRYRWFVTTDERVLVYDDENMSAEQVEERNLEQLAEHNPDAYAAVKTALGETPIIDL